LKIQKKNVQHKRKKRKIISEQLSYTIKPKTQTHKRKKENDIRASGVLDQTKNSDTKRKKEMPYLNWRKEEARTI